MTADDLRVKTRPHLARRITATVCLVLSLTMVCASPTLGHATIHDYNLKKAKDRQIDQRRRLLQSGASLEALQLHRDASQTQIDRLQIRRRVNNYARITTHFGITFGLFLTWRLLRQPGGANPPTPRP